MNAGARVIALSLLAAVLVAGYWLTGRAERASRDRIASFEEAVGPSDDSEVEVGSMARDLKFDQARFLDGIKEDIAAFGIDDVTMTALAEAQPHHIELPKPINLASGRRWASPRIELKATVEKVNYAQHGATVSAAHRVLTVRNASELAVAYRLEVGVPGEEKCTVRGARQHNAIALRPGETAEVVVCAGRGPIRVTALESLGLTELGYLYVSQLPPAAVGYDTVTAHAHRPLVKVSPCGQTDPTQIGRWLADGALRWVDVMDFFARHDCHDFQIFPEYRHAVTPLSRLPVLPPDMRDGS